MILEFFAIHLENLLLFFQRKTAEKTIRKSKITLQSNIILFRQLSDCYCQKGNIYKVMQIRISVNLHEYRITFRLEGWSFLVYLSVASARFSDLAANLKFLFSLLQTLYALRQQKRKQMILVHRS